MNNKVSMLITSKIYYLNTQGKHYVSKKFEGMRKIIHNYYDRENFFTQNFLSMNKKLYRICSNEQTAKGINE